MRIAGVDEAGRGPVLGPMVVACVVASRDKIEFMEVAGVKDSKALTKRQRTRLARIIAENADEILVRVISTQEIDAAVEGISYRNLNYLEAGIAAEILNCLKTPVEIVYIDSPDPNPQRYAKLVQEKISKRFKIIAENDADKKYPIVAAASIIAKVERDKLIEELAKKYGNLGSGYPGDWRTISFLRKWIRDKGEPPPFARKSWKTVKKIIDEYRTRRII